MSTAMSTLLADLDELEADRLEVVVGTLTDWQQAGLESITIEGLQGGSGSFQMPAMPNGYTSPGCVCLCSTPCCTRSSCWGGCGCLSEATPSGPSGDTE